LGEKDTTSLFLSIKSLFSFTCNFKIKAAIRFTSNGTAEEFVCNLLDQIEEGTTFLPSGHIKIARLVYVTYSHPNHNANFDGHMKCVAVITE